MLYIPHLTTTAQYFTSRCNFPHLALSNIPHTRTPHSTSRRIPHHTFCLSIIPCLKLQHSTSHHISHTTPRFLSHHNPHQITRHITAHHSTSRPHSISHYAMHIAKFKYKFHITLFHITLQTTPHIPHCISTIIPHHHA